MRTFWTSGNDESTGPGRELRGRGFRIVPYPQICTHEATRDPPSRCSTSLIRYMDTSPSLKQPPKDEITHHLAESRVCTTRIQYQKDTPHRTIHPQSTYASTSTSTLTFFKLSFLGFRASKIPLSSSSVFPAVSTAKK